MRLIHGDCLEVLDSAITADCIFADPPDNIELAYNEYKDGMPDSEYVEWLEFCVVKFIDVAPIIWISFNAKWTFAMGKIFTRALEIEPDLEAKPCVQVFTFGQHRDTDLGNNHRPLWRLKRKDAPLYPDQIRVPSWRQRHGDKRACSKGRVPGDVFDMQPPPPALNGHLNIRLTRDEKVIKDEMTGIEIPINPGDVFDFPRVTGNSKQRCDWHPTQLHEELVERCIKLSTREGGTVIDPFGGTGTTMRVCKQINRDCTLIEYDKSYCKKIAAAHGISIETAS